MATSSIKWEGHPRIKTSGSKLPQAAKVTPAELEKRNKRSNKPFFAGYDYHNEEATKDGIKHFVRGMGDDNPLYLDAEYAAKSRYKKIIAPGTYLYSIYWVPLGSGIAGVHAWYSGGDWEWYKPIYVGDRFKIVVVIRDVVIKEGRMVGGGKLYINYTDVVYINQKNEIVGKELQHTVWAEREASGEAGKYLKTPKPKYSKEDWIRILDAFDKQKSRGSTPRYWEDVKVGDQVGPMLKGPLTVRDELAWLMGAGSPFFRADKIEYQFEKRHPDALEYCEARGEADVPELVHIFDEYAQTIGIERAYDYGHQRMSWMGNLLTDWMGDDGFLWRMSGDLRVFNQMGDLTTFEGKVTRKYKDGGKCCVDVESWAKNQRNEWSMPPHISTIILPSKEHGPAVFPEPPAPILEDVKKAQPLQEMIAKGLI